jgi:hypothetical protein
VDEAELREERALDGLEAAVLVEERLLEGEVGGCGQDAGQQNGGVGG